MPRRWCPGETHLVPRWSTSSLHRSRMCWARTTAGSSRARSATRASLCSTTTGWSPGATTRSTSTGSGCPPTSTSPSRCAGGRGSSVTSWSPPPRTSPTRTVKDAGSRCSSRTRSRPPWTPAESVVVTRRSDWSRYLRVLGVGAGRVVTASDSPSGRSLRAMASSASSGLSDAHASSDTSERPVKRIIVWSVRRFTAGTPRTGSRRSHPYVSTYQRDMRQGADVDVRGAAEISAVTVEAVSDAHSPGPELAVSVDLVQTLTAGLVPDVVGRRAGGNDPTRLLVDRLVALGGLVRPRVQPVPQPARAKRRHASSEAVHVPVVRPAREPGRDENQEREDADRDPRARPLRGTRARSITSAISPHTSPMRPMPRTPSHESRARQGMAILFGAVVPAMGSGCAGPCRLGMARLVPAAEIDDGRISMHIGIPATGLARGGARRWTHGVLRSAARGLRRAGGAAGADDAAQPAVAGGAAALGLGRRAVAAPRIASARRRAAQRHARRLVPGPPGQVLPLSALSRGRRR